MGLHAQYNNCGFKCEGSEDIAGKISENRHFRRPHSHLKPPLQRIPVNIRINLTLLETASLGYIFAADNWVYLAPLRRYVGSKARTDTDRVHNCRPRSFQGRSRSLILVPIESAYSISY